MDSRYNVVSIVVEFWTTAPGQLIVAIVVVKFLSIGTKPWATFSKLTPSVISLPPRPQVTKDDIIQEMMKVTEGVVDVIVYPSASDKSKNRGFAFVEYDSHRSAAMARRKLMNNRIQLWGHNIAVDWAEPELEVDEEIMSQVCVTVVNRS